MDIDRRLMYIKAIFRYKQMTGQEKVPVLSLLQFIMFTGIYGKFQSPKFIKTYNISKMILLGIGSLAIKQLQNVSRAPILT